MKEMIKRAFRTFFQTAAGYIATNLVCAISGITDFGVLKTAVIGLFVSSLAAGLAAVMNIPDGSPESESGSENKSSDDESGKNNPSASTGEESEEEDER